jgi:hypothetical protein
MQTIVPSPKLTKLTKPAKIQVIKTAIKEGTFDRDEMAQILGVKDRQVRRYLNEIAKQEAELNPEGTHILRSLCINNLTKKAALGKLSTTIEVGIVLAGEVKKELTISKEDITITNNRTFNLTSYSDEDKIAILDAYRRLNKNGSSPIESRSIH